MRSSPLLMAVTILMAVVPLGCKPREQAPSVVIYVSYDQNISEPLLREFEARSGIRVLPVFDVEAAKTTGLVNRLIAEQQSPQADVWMNGEFVQTLKLKQRGILTPYRSPAAEALPDQYVDPEGYWTGLPGRARVVLVNTDRVALEQYPAGIEDLADPAWGQHQVSMAYPIFGTTATEAAAMYAWLGPEQALAFYKRLKAAGVRIVDGNATSRDLISSGEVKAGLTDSDDAWGAVKRGAPVKIIIPAQEDGGRGTLVIPGTVAETGQARAADAEGRVLLNLAVVYGRLGELGPSWNTAAEVEEMAEEQGDPRSRMLACEQRAEVYRLCGRHREALASFDDAARVAASVDDERKVVSLRAQRAAALACWHGDPGDLEEARTAVDDVEAAGLRDVAAWLRLEVAATAPDVATARRWLDGAEEDVADNDHVGFVTDLVRLRTGLLADARAAERVRAAAACERLAARALAGADAAPVLFDEGPHARLLVEVWRLRQDGDADGPALDHALARCREELAAQAAGLPRALAAGRVGRPDEWLLGLVPPALTAR